MTIRSILIAFLVCGAVVACGAEEPAAAAPEAPDAVAAPAAGTEKDAAEGAANEDPLRPEVSLELGLFGKYVWRMMNYNSHPVLQPDLSATVYGFTAEIWGVRDLTKDNRDASGNLIELDWALYYGRELELEGSTLEFSAGMWSYNYPNTDGASTHELFATASIAPAGIGEYFAPGVEIYYDIEDARDALWVQPKITGGYALPKLDAPVYAEALNWNLFTGLSNRAYNRFNFVDGNGDALNETAWVGGGVALELPCKIEGADYLTITPSMQLTTIWDSDARDGSDHPDNFMWGLTVGLSF